MAVKKSPLVAGEQPGPLGPVRLSEGLPHGPTSMVASGQVGFSHGGSELTGVHPETGGGGQVGAEPPLQLGLHQPQGLGDS